MSFEISILILSKDRPEYIGPCLQSLNEMLPKNSYEILLGDTGSKNLDVLPIYKNFQDKLGERLSINSLETYHFSKNNNELAKTAKGKILVFLNNDTLTLNDWLSPLLETFHTKKNVGIIGGKLLYPGNNRVQHAGISINTTRGKFFPHHRFHLVHAKSPMVNNPEIVDAVTGAMLAIDKDLFVQLNGFSEEYRSEAQDVDLCLKAKTIGKDTFYNPKIELIHIENGTRPKFEANSQDRALLQTRWQDKFTPALRNPRNSVLFQRAGARGDVLACAQVIHLYKLSYPDHFVTLKTDYTELVDAYPSIDRVIHTNTRDDFQYEKTFRLSYEDGGWKDYPGTWLDFLSSKVLKNPFGENQYQPPAFSLADQKFDQLIELRAQKEKFLVMATGAGWAEREWAPGAWTELAALLVNKGFKILQIGTDRDFLIPQAEKFLHRNLQNNYSLIRNASAFVGLDSYSFHIAACTQTPIFILTCKTCSKTVWLPKSATEIRNVDARTTPQPFCRTEGCRIKAGNGLQNRCSSPILKNLPALVVARKIYEKLGVQNGNA